jgi:ubiquinone/menaquinone biosynthesis C-methylase UbiE
LNTNSSYQIKEVSANVQLELNRLKAQIEMFWDKECKRYMDFGLQDGMSVIELGCGPGFLLEKINKRFPNADVIGLEIDPFLVNYSNQYFQEKAAKKVQIIEGSIEKTGLMSNSFDFAIVRLVLEHLSDPVKAVKEVFRILKPGGKIVVIDNDFDIHLISYPNISQLRILYEAYCKSMYADGGNPKIGRELPNILRQGGFSKVDLEIINAHSSIIGDEVFFKSEGMGIPIKLVQKGFLPGKILGDISIQWRNMVRTENHVILRQLYMAVGEKIAIEGN